jgi:hypothetical protein
LQGLSSAAVWQEYHGSQVAESAGSVLDLVDAWRRQGARLVADGGLAADEIVAALDATEPR